MPKFSSFFHWIRRHWIQKFRSDYWILRNYHNIVDQIIVLQKTKSQLSNQELTSEAIELKKKLHNANQKVLTESLVTAYALMAEAIRRIHKIRLYRVQFLGAIALHFGNVSEMKTGEGKTLTALLPAYLNSLTGQPAYIVTVNEYLVSRDYEVNKKIFAMLDCHLGQILSNMSKEEKMENYRKNVIYATNSEIGFDYLRDNMRTLNEAKMQQSLNYVIIDEADSILIDESRTPLVISGNPINRQDLYQTVEKFTANLKPTDFHINKEFKSVYLTKSGFLKAQSFFKISDLVSVDQSELFHFVQNSLHARYLLQKNIDYLKRQNKIMLIDHFTGRVLENRMLSYGLHQALEAKENVPISTETSILATITYQNFFRLFNKIAGMTGTALELEDEFIQTYNMHVLCIPSNKPLIRDDQPDIFFTSKKAKYLALAKEIEHLHNKKQPVLVGSNSVQTSEEISQLLRFMRVPHSVLSAKHHAEEAQIIAQAGRSGNVTIATNIAGRGTDIILDEDAKKLGGLVVLGAERNESSRIDWQLRGRSGRQGEPGRSQFYVSLGDDLFLRFGSANIQKRFQAYKFESFSSPILTKIFHHAQNKLTNMSFDQRKTLLDFDNVVAQQRNLIYAQRNFLFNLRSPSNYFQNFFHKYCQLITRPLFQQQLDYQRSDLLPWAEQIKKQLIISSNAELTEMNFWSEKDLQMWLEKEIKMSLQNFQIKYKKLDVYKFACQTILMTIDQLWIQQINELAHSKSGAFLHSYAQKQPLEKFIEKAEASFGKLQKNIFLKATPIILKNLNSLDAISKN